MFHHHWTRRRAAGGDPDTPGSRQTPDVAGYEFLFVEALINVELRAQ